MLNWVKKHRPPIVILENVCSAPWPTVVKKFEDAKYSAKSIRLDTKAYYVPHTRTRGYMMAVNAQSSSIPNRWADRMVSMKRDASCTLDAFLLPSDDPRIHQAREKLVQESYNAQDRKTGRTDWGRCESRHQRTRLEEALGAKRPLTNWDEGMWWCNRFASYSYLSLTRWRRQDARLWLGRLGPRAGRTRLGSYRYFVAPISRARCRPRLQEVRYFMLLPYGL